MRKTKIVTIDAGRDAGKSFLITEMPTTKSEKWAFRFFLAMAHAGIQVPDEIAQGGLAGLAALGIVGCVKFVLNSVGGIAWNEAEPLLDEMFTCVSCVPDMTRLDQLGNPIARGLIPDDTEEIATRYHLRKEIVTLHLEFFFTANN